MSPAPRSLDALASAFAAHRAKLYAIAHRTLGSPWDADDAIQETWLRLQRADARSIANLEAWATTVLSRVCIDMIRGRSRRREDLLDDAEGAAPTDAASGHGLHDPADVVLRSDDLSLALQVMLDHLGPLERLALVLHDVFALPYEDIAPIVERTPIAARQLASRARAKLRGVEVASLREQREQAISSFLAAAREGDFAGLLQLLDPEIELRADPAAVELSAAGADDGAPLLADSVRGVDAVARVFAGRAALTRLVVIDGVPGAAYISDGVVHAAYLLTIDAGRIVGIDILADPAHLASLDSGH